MANSSWRKRRWNVFRQAYDNDQEFRKELSAIKIQFRDDKVIEDDETEKLGPIFSKYGIPIDIWQACMYFLVKPDEHESVYSDMVMPPFLFWNAERNIVEPFTGGLTVSELIKTRLEMARDAGDISFDISKINYLELAEAIFSFRTVIEVLPNVGKEELKDLITDFSTELDSLIKDPKYVRLHGKKLLGKVQPTKTKKHAERDELIAQLYNEHETDYSIRIELRDKGYGDLEENNIKQIRFKLGLTKKQSKKPKS
jgi:hypothetical protein